MAKAPTSPTLKQRILAMHAADPSLSGAAIRRALIEAGAKLSTTYVYQVLQEASEGAGALKDRPYPSRQAMIRALHAEDPSLRNCEIMRRVRAVFGTCQSCLVRTALEEPSERRRRAWKNNSAYRRRVRADPVSLEKERAKRRAYYHRRQARLSPEEKEAARERVRKQRKNEKAAEKAHKERLAHLLRLRELIKGGASLDADQGLEGG